MGGDPREASLRGSFELASEETVARHEQQEAERDIERLIDSFNISSLLLAMHSGIGLNEGRGGDEKSAVDRMQNLPSRDNVRQAILLMANCGYSGTTGWESLTPDDYIATLYQFIVSFPENDDRYDKTLSFLGTHESYCGTTTSVDAEGNEIAQPLLEHHYGDWDPLCSTQSGTFAMLLNHRNPLRIAQHMIAHGMSATPMKNYASVCRLPLVHYTLHILDAMVCMASLAGDNGVPKSLAARVLMASRDELQGVFAELEKLQGGEGPAVTLDVGMRVGFALKDFVGKCFRLYQHYIRVLYACTDRRHNLAIAVMTTTPDLMNTFHQIEGPHNFAKLEAAFDAANIKNSNPNTFSNCNYCDHCQ